MATINLVRGMGSFFKECEHPESRWPRCPHDDKIPYSNAAGRQAEESGFSAQEKAKACLAEVYQARKNSPQSQHKAERIQKYGPMRFEQYATEWRAGPARPQPELPATPRLTARPPPLPCTPEPPDGHRPTPRHTRCRRRRVPPRRRTSERLRHAQRGSAGRQHQQHRGQQRVSHHRAGQPDHEDLRPPSSTARSATTATSRSRHGSSTPSSGTRTRTAPLTATCSAARET